MQALHLILKAIAAVTVLLVAFVLAGGADWLVERSPDAPGKPKRMLQVGSAVSSSDAAAITARETPPETDAPTGDEPGPAQSEDAPAQGEAAPAEGESAKIEASPTSPFDTKAVDSPIKDDEMVRLVATTPQLPAQSLAHIPGLVLKFAPAKVLFGAVKEPSKMASRSIGFYARGCLAGAKPLPVNGPAWQAMRLSRNRMWGHPSLVRYIERFAKDAKEKDGWPGLLVGDMSLPRGGPMPFGHASHQVGLDVDIWYKPMPDHVLSDEEREKLPMESFLLDPAHVNPAVWTPDFVKLLRRAVSYPEVTRVFVHPAIKKWLCVNVKENRAFLRKIHPIIGHDDHFHVRLACPAGNATCRNQPDRVVDEGCGKSLDDWIARLSKAKADTVARASGPRPIPLRATKANRLVTVEQLPPDCSKVLQAPSLTAAK